MPNRRPTFKKRGIFGLEEKNKKYNKFIFCFEFENEKKKNTNKETTLLTILDFCLV